MADNTEKKIDKLGRVRPRTYSHKKKPPKKAKYDIVNHSDQLIETDYAEQTVTYDYANSTSAAEDTPPDPANELHEGYSKGQGYQNDQEEAHTETIEEVILRLFENEDKIDDIMCQNDDQDLISDTKWEELMESDAGFMESVDNIIEHDEECKDSDENTFTDTDGKAPIYHGHHMNINTSMVLVLLFSICHKVSAAMLNDLLTLISLHCLYPHSGLKSIYAFKQYFANLQSPLTKHYYCTLCMADVCINDEICPNETCHNSLKSKKGKSYFIEIPLEDQIKNILEKKGIIGLMQQRFSRKKKGNDRIEDIYDGNIYRKLSESGGVLSSDYPYNISLTWNTDGIPIFKSSKMSIWPLYLTINELPIKHRMQTENMLLYGLWFGESKPLMSSFTKPLVKVLRKLQTVGVDFEVDGQFKNSKGYLLCGTADLPAKSIIMNCNQFNGEYSCMKCMHPGETFRTVKGGSVRIFPHDSSKPQYKERTTVGCLEDSVKAIEDKKNVHGIKGPSFLMIFSTYDYVRSTSIDYMHGVLLGVTRLLINLWTGGSTSKEEFSISTSISVIDERLKQIKPPSYISRAPRTIASHLKYWKASELRTWLFFYSIPILQDILPKNYLFHYACFVEGIYLLCSDSISIQDLQRSNTMLSYFVHMFKSMYGARYVTLNMHSLLHLPQCVEDLGPLWVYSCFAYENANGILTELFHGTQNIELQIISSLNIVRNMPELLLPIQDPVHRAFIEKMKGSSVVQKMHFDTLSGAYPVGSPFEIVLPDDIYSKLVSEIKYVPTKWLFYRRISLRGFIIHSIEYSRVQVRNTFTIKYYDSSKGVISYGMINYFILSKKCDCVDKTCKCESTAVAVMTSLEEIKPSVIQENFLSVKVDHIKVTRKTNQMHVVDCSRIISVMVNVCYTNNDNHIYLCEVPNLKESD